MFCKFLEDGPTQQARPTGYQYTGHAAKMEREIKWALCAKTCWCCEMETFFILLTLCEGKPSDKGSVKYFWPLVISLLWTWTNCLNKQLSCWWWLLVIWDAMSNAYVTWSCNEDRGTGTALWSPLVTVVLRYTGPCLYHIEAKFCNFSETSLAFPEGSTVQHKACFMR